MTVPGGLTAQIYRVLTYVLVTLDILETGKHALVSKPYS